MPQTLEHIYYVMSNNNYYMVQYNKFTLIMHFYLTMAIKEARIRALSVTNRGLLLICYPVTMLAVQCL